VGILTQGKQWALQLTGYYKRAGVSPLVHLFLLIGWGMVVLQTRIVPVLARAYRPTVELAK
jgi:hypothetical protein